MAVPPQFNVPFDPVLGQIFVRVLYGNERAGAYQNYVVDRSAQTDPSGPWSITCDVFQQDAAHPQQLRHRATTNGLEGVLKDGVAAKYFFLRFV